MRKEVRHYLALLSIVGGLGCQSKAPPVVKTAPATSPTSIAQKEPVSQGTTNKSEDPPKTQEAPGPVGQLKSQALQGPYQELSQYCKERKAKGCSCEPTLSQSFTVSGDFQEAGLLLVTCKESKEAALAIQKETGWLIAEAIPALEETVKDQEKRRVFTVKNHRLEQREGAISLALIAERHTDIFCETCGNVAMRTIPSTVYNTEVAIFCGAAPAGGLSCSLPIESIRDQDGASKILYQATSKGEIELKDIFWPLWEAATAPLPAGVYTIAQSPL